MIDGPTIERTLRHARHGSFPRILEDGCAADPNPANGDQAGGTVVEPASGRAYHYVSVSRFSPCDGNALIGQALAFIMQSQPSQASLVKPGPNGFPSVSFTSAP